MREVAPLHSVPCNGCNNSMFTVDERPVSLLSYACCSNRVDAPTVILLLLGSIKLVNNSQLAVPPNIPI